jgi:hypothetical protein
MRLGTADTEDLLRRFRCSAKIQPESLIVCTNLNHGFDSVRGTCVPPERPFIHTAVDTMGKF